MEPWPLMNACLRWNIWVERFLWLAALAAGTGFLAMKAWAWSAGDIAGGGDDFQAYYCASHILRQEPTGLYAPDIVQRLRDKQIACMPYLYPPTIALLLWPLADFSFFDARRIWFVINLVSIAGIVMGLWVMASNRLVRFVALGMFFLSPATWDALYLGQISPLLGCLVTWAVWLGARMHPATNFAAGFLLALAGGIKQFVLALALLAPWHRRWSMGLGFVAGIFLIVLPGLVALPLTVTLRYGELLLSMSSRLATPGDSIFWNQSVMALWEKLSQSTSGQVVLQGQQYSFAVQSSVPAWLVTPAKLFTVAGMLSVTLWMIFQLCPFHLRFDIHLSVIGLLLLCALMVTPLTWNHYLVIGAPIYLAVAEQVNAPASIWRMLIPLGFLLTVLQRGAVLWLQFAPVYPLTSLFLGGIFLWWMVMIGGCLSANRLLRERGVKTDSKALTT